MKAVKVLTWTAFMAAVLLLGGCGKSRNSVVEPQEEVLYSGGVKKADTMAGGGNKNAGKENSGGSGGEKGDANMIYAHIGDNVLEILLEDNSSAEAMIELLEQGDLTIDMEDYGGFEKVGSIGKSLPANDQSITTQPGDVILYQGNSITIYYGVNSWNFTRLGKVQGLWEEELKTILGDGAVTVRFSMQEI